ncbi:hypothetical protein NL529_29885, partial [Klebsiella pneumoniae]|nr:hypothetical protein [Klebsiella pneumoniae]
NDFEGDSISQQQENGDAVIAARRFGELLDLDVTRVGRRRVAEIFDQLLRNRVAIARVRQLSGGL